MTTEHAAHTPEPWEASRDAVPDWHEQTTIYAGDGQRIATVFRDADVPLIKAAPALLAALERHTCVKCDKRFGWDGVRPDCDFCTDARAALAQARDA